MYAHAIKLTANNWNAKFAEKSPFVGDRKLENIETFGFLHVRKSRLNYALTAEIWEFQVCVTFTTIWILV